MRAGQYATLTGDKTTAEAFLMRAMRDARASSREEEIVEAQTLLAELRLSMGEAGEGVKLADDALETARRCMLSPDRVAPALLVSARCRTRDGRPREAEALLREILETQQAPKEVQVNAALELANNMWGKENERERESLLFRAVELAQAEPGSVLAVALLNLSNFYIFGAVHGGPAAPRRVEGDLRHALQTAEQNGADPRLLAPILEALGLYFLLGRDFRTADAFLRRALAEWRRINNDSGIAYTLGYLSIVLGELGRAEEARAMTDEAMLPAQQAGNADGLKFHLSSVAKAAGAERFGGVASSA
jgi:tetratricopeptide (TPR) repeat protein